MHAYTYVYVHAYIIVQYMYMSGCIPITYIFSIYIRVAYACAINAFLHIPL